MIAGIGSMIVFGAACVATLAWLCSREGVWLRRADILLASLVAACTGGLALILVTGSIAEGTSRRLGGSLSVVILGLTAGVSIWSARGGLARCGFSARSLGS